MMETPRIDWMPAVAAGLPLSTTPALEALVTTAWKLAIDGRALVEDFEGAEHADLVTVLKLKFLELLADIDLDLRGTGEIEEEHLLPLALEHGLGELARLPGAEVAEALGICEAEEPHPYARIEVEWAALLEAFPGEVPDPLASDGQGPALRALRAWSKLCRKTGVDDAFLIPLMKAV